MAALPLVGLEAVIAGLPGFNAGANAIISAYDNIEKKAGNVQKATHIMGGAFSSITSPISALAGQFVGLGQNVLKFGAVAGGAALVGVTALAAGVVALGASALTETAKYERMSLSITNLVAREISQGEVVEQQRQVLAGLTAKETEELQKLQDGLDNESNQRDILTARIQEQKEKINQLTAQYGENGLVVIKERAELQGMELDLADLNKEISDHKSRITELSGQEGKMVTVMEKVRVGQMSMSDAMAQAGPRAQELLKWIQILAIQSPFNQEDIANSFRTALAYGFTTEKAQRLTTAMVDFTAATGKTGESANLIALALGQIQARGKLSAQELRQLSEQGVGVNAILDKMGFSLDDVTNGLVDTDAFIEAVIADMEIFRGAGKAQSNTLAGLTASMQDLKGIALREFFTGTFNAIRPYVAEFVGWLTNAAIQTGAIKKLGETLGQYVAGALKKIGEFIAAIRAGGLAVFSEYLGAEGIPLWYELKELIGNISGSLAGLGSLFSDNLSGPLTDFTTNIIPLITQGIAFVNDHFEEFKGALIGVGAVLGVGVFAAIVAGILSLLTPINLIIAGAALLGAAWVGNWGGIQEKTFAVWAVIQPIFSQIVTWLQTNIPIAIQYVSDFWTNILYPAMLTVGAWITGTLIPTLTDIWTWLQTNIPTAIQASSDFWTTTLLPALTAVGNYINQNIIPFLEALGNVISAIVNKAIEAGAGLWQNVLYPALTTVGNYLSETLSPVFISLGEWLEGTFGPILETMGGEWLPSISSAFDGITSAIQGAITWLNELATNITTLELPSWLQPGSPTPFELGLQGIATTITTLVIIAVQGMDLVLTNVIAITIPLLVTGFTNLFTLITNNLNAITLGPLTLFIVTLTTIYLTHFPLLQSTALTTTTSIVTGLNSVLSVMNSIIASLGIMISHFGSLGAIATAAGNAIKAGMEKAADAIEELIDIIKEAAEAFEGMANAARDAADAAASAGNASGAAGGLGFQSGTPEGGFLVPPGFPNDSFPLRVQSGERVFVVPQGQTLSSMTSNQSTTNYNFSMNVNTGANPKSVIQQYQIMRAMVS